MRFSQFAGIAIVPTLSRLVLALIFVTAGFNKIFTRAVFDEGQATRLHEMGAEVRPRVEPVAVDHVHWGHARLAAFSLDEPEASPPPRVTGSEPLPPGEYEALSLYRIALICQDKGMQGSPFWLAWIAAITEFVGGILLLIGLLSRFWALGLAIAMLTAIALTTWEPYLTTGPFTVAGGIGADGSPDGMRLFNQVGAQLALFVLAFGVFLTGPGPLSLDHLLVRRQSQPTDALGYDIDEQEDDDVPPPAERHPRSVAPDRDQRRDPVSKEAPEEEIPITPPPPPPPAIHPPKQEPTRSHERPI